MLLVQPLALPFQAPPSVSFSLLPVLLVPASSSRFPLFPSSCVIPFIFVLSQLLPAVFEVSPLVTSFGVPFTIAVI